MSNTEEIVLKSNMYIYSKYLYLKLYIYYNNYHTILH